MRCFLFIKFKWLTICKQYVNHVNNLTQNIMIVVMQHTATREMSEHVLKVIEEHGLKGEPMYGTQRTAIGVLGEKEKLDEGKVMRLPGVKEILIVSKPYKKVSREYKPENSVVRVGNVEFGTGKPVIIAGPCGVESEEQIMTIARGVKKLGAHMLRGGAYKPRTSPYSFQGMQEEGMKLLAQAKKETPFMFLTPIY